MVEMIEPTLRLEENEGGWTERRGMGWMENKTPNQVIQVGIACTHNAIHTLLLKTPEHATGKLATRMIRDETPGRKKKKKERKAHKITRESRKKIPVSCVDSSRSLLRQR